MRSSLLLCRVPVHTNEVLRFLPFPVVFSFTVMRNSFASSMSSSSTRSHIALSPSLAMTKASTPSASLPGVPAETAHGT